jgi:tetratricopeptide (TPR) repeat protein
VLSTAVACAVLIPTLLAVRHRFVERPDLVLMVFLAFTTYALDAYVREGRRTLYALPALQLLWVNMHPSIVVGVVPFVAVLAGGALEAAAGRRWAIAIPGTPSPHQLRVVGAVLAAVLAASLLNPYGVDAFVAPFRLGAATWFRHEVVELQPPRLGQDPAPFAIAALLALGFVVTVRRLCVVSVLLVLPFAALAFSARRFIFLFAVVSAPVLARHVRLHLGRVSEARARRLELPAALVAAGLLAGVMALWAARAGPMSDPLKEPGFGINRVTVPEGALDYLRRAGVSGRVFNTFQWGGYIAWRDFPRLVPFMDGRGAVPDGLLDEAMVVRRDPGRLDRLRSTYGFEVAIVDYALLPSSVAGAPPDVDVSWSSPRWALVYWDDLALVYLRRDGPLAALVQRDEYRLVRPANGAQQLRGRLDAGVPLAAVEAELRRNVADTGSSMGLALLGFLYNAAGRHADAVEALRRVRAYPVGWSNLPNAYRGLGFAYERLGQPASALEYYTKAAELDESADVLHSLGVLAARTGDDGRAVPWLERALEKDPNLLAAYPVLIAAYRRAGRPADAGRLEGAFAAAVTRSKAEQYFHRGLRLYLEGKHAEAISAFGASLRLIPRSPAALSNLGFVYFDVGRTEDALTAQRQALEADPGFANAHYGLALIHQRLGDGEQARAHFARYLHLDPRGYWARKAAEALARPAGS